MMPVIVFHPLSSLNFVGLPLRKRWHIFRLSISRLRDLELRPFDPRMWSRIMIFHADFQLLRHAILDLGSGANRETDGQTEDGHKRTMSHPMERGILILHTSGL